MAGCALLWVVLGVPLEEHNLVGVVRRGTGRAYPRRWRFPRFSHTQERTDTPIGTGATLQPVLVPSLTVA